MQSVFTNIYLVRTLGWLRAASLRVRKSAALLACSTCVFSYRYALTAAVMLPPPCSPFDLTLMCFILLFFFNSSAVPLIFRLELVYNGCRVWIACVRWFHFDFFPERCPRLRVWWCVLLLSVLFILPEMYSSTSCHMSFGDHRLDFWGWLDVRTLYKYQVYLSYANIHKYHT